MAPEHFRTEDEDGNPTFHGPTPGPTAFLPGQRGENVTAVGGEADHPYNQPAVPGADETPGLGATDNPPEPGSDFTGDGAPQPASADRSDATDPDASGDDGAAADGVTDGDGLDDATAQELRDIAKSEDVPGRSGKNSEELRQLIRQHRAG